jgi:hypothetical protein
LATLKQGEDNDYAKMDSLDHNHCTGLGGGVFSHMGHTDGMARLISWQR